MNGKMFITFLAIGMLGGAVIATNSQKTKDAILKGQNKIKNMAKSLTCDCNSNKKHC